MLHNNLFLNIYFLMIIIMPKKSKKSRYNNNNCIKSDDEEQEQEQEPQPIYFKSKYKKIQSIKIEKLTQDFLKNNIINFNSY